MTRYISNGTEGAFWTEDNCERCARDHEWHDDNNGTDTCPVYMALMTGKYPIEGLVVHAAEHRMPARLKCTYWQPCTGCGVDPTDVPMSWEVDQ